MPAHSFGPSAAGSPLTAQSRPQCDWDGTAVSCEQYTNVVELLNMLQIVELLNIIYCIAQLVEFAAFLTLRFREPDLHR